MPKRKQRLRRLSNWTILPPKLTPRLPYSNVITNSIGQAARPNFAVRFALNPNYAFAHDQFGLVLAFQGRLDEAVAEGKRATELDPLSPKS